MTEIQKSFVKDLIIQCNQQKTNIFDYSTEMWGLMWTPSFIYIQGKRVKIAIDNLDASDFNFFIAQNIIEEAKKFKKKELDFPLEIARTSYKLLISAI